MLQFGAMSWVHTLAADTPSTRCTGAGRAVPARVDEGVRRDDDAAVRVGVDERVRPVDRVLRHPDLEADHQELQVPDLEQLVAVLVQAVGRLGDRVGRRRPCSRRTRTHPRNGSAGTFASNSLPRHRWLRCRGCPGRCCRGRPRSPAWTSPGRRASTRRRRRRCSARRRLRGSRTACCIAHACPPATASGPGTARSACSGVFSRVELRVRQHTQGEVRRRQAGRPDDRRTSRSSGWCRDR